MEYLTDHLVHLLDRSPLFREWHESDYKVGKKVNQANYFLDCEQSLFRLVESKLGRTGESELAERDLIGIIGFADSLS